MVTGLFACWNQMENAGSRFNGLFVWAVGGVFRSVRTLVGDTAEHLPVRWCGGMWREKVIG
jgi:hypothetical protein